MSRHFCAAGLLVAVLAAYASSLQGGFVFDDIPAIAGNPHVRSLWPLTAAMSTPPEVTTAGRPVAALSFAVSYALAGGYDTWWYHATNVAIHALATLLLFGMVRRTLSGSVLRDRFARAATPLAFSVALVWALHPLQTQAVTYIVQRVESLMGLFLLATLYCAIRAVAVSHESPVPPVPKRRNKRSRNQPPTSNLPRSRRWPALAVLFCALGMATKQTMVGAPLLVVCWDYLFARAWRPKLYASLAATWAMLAALVLSGARPHSVGSIGGWTPVTYLMTQPGVILHYLRLAVFPSPLVFDYDWPPATTVTAVLWPALVVFALVAATIVGLVRRHPAAFAGAWFFVILAPTSSVLPIATEVAAEHRMYLPLAAVVAFVVIGTYALAGGGQLKAGSRRREAGSWQPFAAAAIVIAVVFGAMTSARNHDYASDERIWIDTIAKRPSNARAHHNYAVSLFEAGRLREAEQEARTAASLVRPGSVDEAKTYRTLGAVLGAAQKFDESIAALQHAIRVNPQDDSAYRNLGEAYGARGDFPSAAAAFVRAAQLTPGDPRVLSRAATAYAAAGQFDAAIASGNEAIAVARATGQSAMIPELEQQLAAYRARRPIRVP